MRPCTKPWGSENASYLHEEEGLEGVRSARVKSQLGQVQACSAPGLVFLLEWEDDSWPLPAGQLQGPGSSLFVSTLAGDPPPISSIRMWGAGTRARVP